MAKENPKHFRFKRLAGINSRAEEGALLPFGATGASLSEIGKYPALPMEMRDIENFNALRRGGKSKTFGFEIFKATGGASITGLYRFIRTDGTSLFLFSQGAKLNKLVSGTVTELGTNEVGSGAYLDFETAYDYCVICDGTQAPKKFDGTTVSALGGSPPNQARQSIFLRNRLFMFGSSTDPSLLYYSDAGNIESGYGSNFINCDIDDGQSITGIKELFIPGELEPIIIVGKTRSIGVVTGDGTADNPFTFYKVNTDFGAPAFRSFVQFGQNLAYLTYSGVKSYKTDLALVNLAQNDLTELVEDQFNDLDRVALGESIAWHDPKYSRISFAVPESGATDPNVIWHYDTRDEFWYKERYGTGTITAVLVDSDGAWYHGDSSGNIWKHNETVHNFGGDPIVAVMQTDYIDFFEPTLLKRIIEARLTLRGNGAYNLGVSVRIDNGSQTGQTQQITLTRPSYTWGGGVWTSNSGTYQWGAACIDINRFIPSGYFRNIQFEFSNSNEDQPIDLFDLEFLVEFQERR